MLRLVYRTVAYVKEAIAVNDEPSGPKWSQFGRCEFPQHEPDRKPFGLEPESMFISILWPGSSHTALASIVASTTVRIFPLKRKFSGS